MSALGMTKTVLATGLLEAMRADLPFAFLQPPTHLTAHVQAWLTSVAEMLAKPIDMVLYCPNCGKQHIDAPDPEGHTSVASDGTESRWDNPVHCSHLCATCGCVWRPADVPTNGVERTTTRGKADTTVRDARRS